MRKDILNYIRKCLVCRSNKNNNTTPMGQMEYNLRTRPTQLKTEDKGWRRNKVLSNATNILFAKLGPQYKLSAVYKKRPPLAYDLKNPDETKADVWHIKDLKVSHGSDDVLSSSKSKE